MTEAVPEALRAELEVHGQDHVLRWWDELDADGRAALVGDLEAVDLERLASLHGSKLEDVDASAAQAPRELVGRPRTDAEHAALAEAFERGNGLLAEGKVAALLVAGGQGTRLGYDKPKGMFPVGPMSGASLFEIFCHQLAATGRRVGTTIPYFVMTSHATHAPTVAYFEEHGYFGLNADDVHFFQQGTMPAVDAATGKLLLAEKGRLATSPDGHGGVLTALGRAGLLDLCRDRGIEHVFYHQVDNPLGRVCDPAFLGFHALRQSELSTKVVSKATPEEKMGVVVDVDGVTRIIEYSDLPDEVAHRRNDAGELDVRAGNIAVHVFDVAFLERLLSDDLALPFHVAHKKVPYVDDTGTVVSPTEPNANKFERFVFDALPHARNALVVEVDRRDEFAPVKNAFGADSPASSLCASVAKFRHWLRAAGVDVPEHVPVEIDPLFAMDPAELAARVEPGTTHDGPVWLHE